MADRIEHAEPLIARAAASGAGRSVDRARASSMERWWLPLVGVVAVALCLPFFRTVFSMGDEGVLLHGAERMLRGDTIYTDFFEFLPPGGFVLTASWLRIAGMSVWSVRTLAIITIAGIACFTYLACRQASRSAPLSAALAVGWVVTSQGVWTQLSHHWITTMFSMVTMWAALAETGGAKRQWPVIAGVAAGAASIVTPTCGVLGTLAALTVFSPLRRPRAAFTMFILSGALVPTCLLLYLVWRHALPAAFDDVILFTATRYASIQSLPFGTGWGIENIPIVFVFPLGVCLALVVCRCGFARDRVFLACAAFGLAGLTTCFPRADVFHIAFETPLICPLLAYCVMQLTASWRSAYRMLAAGMVGVLMMPSMFMFLAISDYVSHAEVVPTQRGGLAFFKLDGAPEMFARIASLPSGDGYFFYPFAPMMPYLAGREHVSKYDILTPEYSLPSQYQDACVSMMRDATWVVMDQFWMDPKTLTATYPSMRDPRPRETEAFERALDAGFDFVARDGTFELRHRRSDASESSCVGIVN